MGLGYFNPHPAYEGARARGCYTCTHHQGRWIGAQVGGQVTPGAHMICEQRGVYVISRPLDGCAYWRREPGADDE